MRRPGGSLYWPPMPLEPVVGLLGHFHADKTLGWLDRQSRIAG